MRQKPLKKPTKYPGVYRLPDGAHLIQIYWTDPLTGKERERERTLPAGLTDAQAAGQRAELLRQFVAAPEVKPGRLSVTDVALQWLEGGAQRWRESVADHASDVVSQRILPHLGEIYIDQLRRTHIEQWVAWAERAKMKGSKTGKNAGRPFARETVAGWWRILTQMLRDVCAEQHLPDPTYRVRPPRPAPAPKRRERRTVAKEALWKLVEAVRDHAPHRYAEAYMLAYSGMRPGEMYALHKDAIVWNEDKIRIERSHRRGVVTATKTDDPREVALTATMKDLLRAQLRHLVEVQHPGLHLGIVFPSDVGGYREPGSIVKPLRAAAKAAGLDVRLGPQVLRRTFNTLMLAEKVDRIILRSQMGHCSEEMTERYAGVEVELKKAAVGRLELVKGPTGNGTGNGDSEGTDEDPDDGR